MKRHGGSVPISLVPRIADIPASMVRSLVVDGMLTLVYVNGRPHVTRESIRRLESRPAGEVAAAILRGAGR